MIKKITLKIKNKKIPIIIGEKILTSNFFKKILPKKPLIIILDDNIKILYKEFLKKNFKTSFIISIPSGEKYKTRKTKAYIEDEMFKKKISKDSILLAIGGGVVLDIASFVASTYMRGINHYLIPTTLLSMVDASIGGKTGINTSFGKNLLGSFYQPKKIFIDISFLSTLSKKEYRSGIGEIIKYAILFDKKLFEASL